MDVLRWAARGILIVWCLANGWVWNLIVMYAMADLKIPIRFRVKAMSVCPWGMSAFCLGITLYFFFQMMAASVTGGDILILNDEKAVRKVARAFGIQGIGVVPTTRVLGISKGEKGQIAGTL